LRFADVGFDVPLLGGLFLPTYMGELLTDNPCGLFPRRRSEFFGLDDAKLSTFWWHLPVGFTAITRLILSDRRNQTMDQDIKAIIS